MAVALTVVGYLLVGFLLTPFVGRWADKEGLVDPYTFAVMITLPFWPVLLQMVALGWCGRHLADAAQAASERWLP